VVDSRPTPPTKSGFEQMSQTGSECPFSIQIAVALFCPRHKDSRPQQAVSLVPITKTDCTHTAEYLLTAGGAVIVFTFFITNFQTSNKSTGCESTAPFIAKSN